MSDFELLFGRPASVQATAAGRVNLIGEHTDYNGGFVLPTLIPQKTRVQLAPRAEDTVAVASANVIGGVEQYRLGREARRGTWVDYVQGVTRTLRQQGHALRGFDALVTSQVPVGSGLSSSAALDVALMRALRGAFNLALDDGEIGRLGQRVENEFVGAQVGIMDPLVCSLGREGMALFIDARSLRTELVPLPAGAELAVIDSGVAHQHSAGDYNTRRAECERAGALLGVGQLRDLAPADLPRLEALPPPLDRRARHVVTENARVLEAVGALRAGDLPRLGRLFNASHDSQRDDYEVSTAEIELLVELARQDNRVYGARLTGGGFGGSIMMLAQAGSAGDCAERVAREYTARSGLRPAVLVPAPT